MSKQFDEKVVHDYIHKLADMERRAIKAEHLVLETEKELLSIRHANSRGDKQELVEKLCERALSTIFVWNKKRRAQQ